MARILLDFTEKVSIGYFYKSPKVFWGFIRFTMCSFVHHYILDTK